MGRLKVTWETFKQRFIKAHGNKYDYSKVEYINPKTKVCIICPEHGEFWQIPNDHAYGRGCPKCGQKVQTKSNKDFIEQANTIHNNKYCYNKTEYINNKTPVIIICSEHGEFKQAPQDHLKGHGCPKCGHILSTLSKKKSLDTFIEEAKQIHGPDTYNYDKVSFNTVKDQIIIKCNTCQSEFITTPDMHVNSETGCPHCRKMSSGEKTINKFLIDNNINYISQYQIDIDSSINSTGKAYIDFYLPKLNIAIEYNGTQHYQYNSYFHKGGVLDFERQQRRDEYVRNYCKENNIKLIEIRYNRSAKNIYQQITDKLL